MVLHRHGQHVQRRRRTTTETQKRPQKAALIIERYFICDQAAAAFLRRRIAAMPPSAVSKSRPAAGTGTGAGTVANDAEKLVGLSALVLKTTLNLSPA